MGFNDKAITEAKKYFGYFALVSNQAMDTFTALENNVMMENQAIGDGGAIFAEADEAGEIEWTLINNTISNNQAAIKADGIYLQSLDQGKIDVWLKNCIVWENATEIFMEKVGTATLSVTTDHSIIGGVGNYVGTYTDNGGNVNADPLLKANNHLNLSSPAKDKAVCGFTVQLNGSSHYIRVAPYDDIDGDPRPGWGITTSCDIGADEYRFPWILFNPAFIKPQ